MLDKFTSFFESLDAKPPNRTRVRGDFSPEFTGTVGQGWCLSSMLFNCVVEIALSVC